MLRNIPAAGLFVLLSFLLNSGEVVAQPLVGQYSTLEAMVASADFVAIGSIAHVKEGVNVTSVDVTNSSGGKQQSKSGYELVPKFDEILKNVDVANEDNDLSSFQTVDQDGRSALVSQLVDDNAKGLWLIHAKTENETNQRWSFLPFGQSGVNHFGYRAPALQPPVFASDLSLLETHEQILQRLREYAPVSQREHTNNQPNCVSVFVPAVFVGDLKNEGFTHHQLVLPIDSNLHETARRLITDPADFVPTGSIRDWSALDTLRMAGIELLGSTKTESNVQLLKECLDATVFPFRKSPSALQFRVRAYEKLIGWRIKPPRPAFASQVRRLALPGADIDDETIRLVTEFENLESICLWGTPVTRSGIDHLGSLKKLKLLELDTHLMDDNVVQTLRANNQLHLISQATTSDYLERPSSPDQVATLRFWCAPFTDSGLKQFADFKNLTTIDLGRMEITDASIDDLCRFKKLKFAVLRETRISKDGFARLRRALPNCSVESQ